MKSKNENQPGGEILLYQTEDGKTRLEVQFPGDTVWLSQAQMSELFQTTKRTSAFTSRIFMMSASWSVPEPSRIP